jgi:streptomycin 6-kinase
MARWRLSAAGEPVAGQTSLVAPVTRVDGTRAMLKISTPHMEADDEIAGLRFWNGDPMVHLLEADQPLHAMLLERCEPGTTLRELPEAEQDEILAGLLRQLWKPRAGAGAFRPLGAMIEFWISEAEERRGSWADESLVRRGIDELRDLVATTRTEVVLHTDLHAANVLRAQRTPWLVIDPKPFIGDPAYDATQHLLNCPGRMTADPLGTIEHYAGYLDVDPDRVRRWYLARLATGSPSAAAIRV